MRKIFYILFLYFISLGVVFAGDSIDIISRDEWGANENYRFTDSKEWQEIFKNREIRANENKNKIYTKEEIESYKLKQAKLKEMDNILVNDYSDYIETEEKIYKQDGRRLAWPIAKSKNINGIVIHHTTGSYKNSLEGIQQIYKFHALTREWGDIGYNYLIGDDGKIYEGRAGGEKIVAAHDKWNNISTVGIALIGDYSNNSINIDQYNALRKLTRYLIDKHDIDLTEKTYFHSECLGDNCELPLKTELKYPIIGHRDAGHTDCPGDKLYKQIDDLRVDLLKEPASVAKLYKKKVFKTFSNFSDEKLIDTLANIEYELDEKKLSRKLKLKGLILDYFKFKKENTQISYPEIKNNSIKVKLSYPDNDRITIETGKTDIEIKRIGNKVYAGGKKFNLIKIPKKNKNSILEITSWDRVPTWDKEEKYNDNKFRGDLIVYANNGELIVVNSLEIEDYLKGLGEVSNFEDPEKIKTIIVSARSYATWYTNKARKFKGKFYDGVDDPNVFQKYLGYGLESRSPNINKIVDETKGQVITYDGELIKPWYFSSSTGNTMSFYDYCIVRYSDDICNKESKKYPYLQSVADKGSEGLDKKGHGVGISGTGVSYFAKKGWSYDMIIKYFLKGVEVL